MRYRVTLDIDTTDPDLTEFDVTDATERGITAMAEHLGGGAYIDLEAIEELGT